MWNERDRAIARSAYLTGLQENDDKKFTLEDMKEAFFLDIPEWEKTQTFEKWLEEKISSKKQGQIKEVFIEMDDYVDFSNIEDALSGKFTKFKTKPLLTKQSEVIIRQIMQ